jgi:hypothetical protein
MKLLLLAFTVFYSFAVSAQNFSQLIDSTYCFTPHNLSQVEQKKYFPKLDEFFHLVMNDTTTYLPLLRTELKKTGHNPYFYFDGAHLLMMSNKKNNIDDKLIVNSFSKADIRDLNPKVLTTLSNTLARRGANTTPIAISILKDTTFSFFIPAHSFEFNQGYCLSYVLLPINNNLYLNKLTANFNSLPDHSKKSILTTIWFGYSCKGDKFLKKVASGKKHSKKVRKYAESLLANNKVYPEITKIMIKLYGDNSDDLWNSSLEQFSDEAIFNLDYVTRFRRQNEQCR